IALEYRWMSRRLMHRGQAAILLDLLLTGYKKDLADENLTDRHVVDYLVSVLPDGVCKCQVRLPVLVTITEIATDNVLARWKIERFSLALLVVVLVGLGIVPVIPCLGLRKKLHLV